VSLQAQQVVASIDNTTVLGGLNCSVQAGQVLGVVGPNGAGKSTLMRVLAGLLEPDSGSVLIDDQDIAGLPRRARARRIAYLPQQGEIHWPISVANVVALGRYPHDEPGAGRGGTMAARINDVMARTGVAQFAHRPMHALSSGERARVLFARALAVQGDHLLADEPVAALDPRAQLEILELMRAEAAAGRGVAVVLHDLSLALRFCDRLLMLQRGQVYAYGSPADVMTPDALREVYGVEALVGKQGGQPYVLPWRPSVR